MGFRGLRASQREDRTDAHLTGLPDALPTAHAAVAKAFVRGGLDGLVGSPFGDWIAIWAVPREEGSDDAFLSIAGERNLIAARVNGAAVFPSHLRDTWKGAAASIRLICLGEGISCKDAPDSEMRALQDEYRRVYTKAKTEELLTNGY